MRLAPFSTESPDLTTTTSGSPMAQLYPSQFGPVYSAPVFVEGGRDEAQTGVSTCSLIKSIS